MSGGDDGYLRKTYDLDSVARVAEHYDAWAASYDSTRCACESVVRAILEALGPAAGRSAEFRR